MSFDAHATTGGDRFDFMGHDFERATGAQTGGAYCLHEIVQIAGAGPPMHVHTREDEMFRVLEGRLTSHAGGERLDAPAGTSAHRPRGVADSFVVETPAARVLQLCVPQGWRPFAEWAGRPGTPEQFTASMAEYGVQVVGRPPGAGPPPGAPPS